MYLIINHYLTQLAGFQKRKLNYILTTGSRNFFQTTSYLKNKIENITKNNKEYRESKNKNSQEFEFY